MWRRVFLALLSAVLPRHPRAARAVALRSEVLASLVAPQALPRAPWIHTLFPYRDERVRSLIQAAKYYGERSVAEKAAPFIADYVTELVAQKTQFEGWRAVRLVPIPASKKRLRERGFSQTAFFARATAALVPDVLLDESLLTREDRPSQVHVQRSERRKNMEHAFSASARAHGAYIILLDDVVESGATLTDARRALKTAGAKKVIALAIAH